MKKVLFLSISLLASTIANAQYIVDGSYEVYQEPYIERSYGNANWSYVTNPQIYQRATYNNSYIQAQNRYGQKNKFDYQEYDDLPPIVSKKFYATLRAGMGKTAGWDENSKTGKVENPTGVILSLSLGTYLTPNVRIDGEFAYHTKDNLYSGKDIYLKGKGDYSQYDFGMNAYYDFNTGTNFKPFIGIGIWGITSKISSDIENTYGDTRDTSRSNTNFALSGALGMAYKMTDSLTLEAMGRARYIFSEDIYNLEGLIGSRFSF